MKAKEVLTEEKAERGANKQRRRPIPLQSRNVWLSKNGLFEKAAERIRKKPKWTKWNTGEDNSKREKQEEVATLTTGLAVPLLLKLLMTKLPPNP
ncbi:hypothetical protein RUM43_006586 [Polyplax serrata]|uniref:Uncharacterized protein n=1 Tax=Polyplax serrata TaxID=468196 RepID=A0AAN8PF66_POLSC